MRFVFFIVSMLILFGAVSVAEANHRDTPEGCDFLPECIDHGHFCDLDIGPENRFETYQGVEYDKLAGCTIDGPTLGQDSESNPDPRKKCRKRWFGAKLRGEPTYKCFGHEYERKSEFTWPQFEVKD